MPTYVYDPEKGCSVDKHTGEPMNPDKSNWTPTVPYIVSDIPGYHSPIDGKWIEGRRARRYDLESNNCVEAGDIKPLGKLKNAKFAKKHGVEHLLEQ